MEVLPRSPASKCVGTSFLVVPSRFDEVQPTVVGRAEPHNLSLVHPTQDRTLTVRENARCQVGSRSVDCNPNLSHMDTLLARMVWHDWASDASPHAYRVRERAVSGVRHHLRLTLVRLLLSRSCCSLAAGA